MLGMTPLFSMSARRLSPTTKSRVAAPLRDQIACMLDLPVPETQPLAYFFQLQACIHCGERPPKRGI